MGKLVIFYWELNFDIIFQYMFSKSFFSMTKSKSMEMDT